VLLNKPISLNIDDIIEKIVDKNLGGYCFEHNKLFYEVLLSLGFDVELILARVSNNQKIESPRTHRVTLLNYKGKKYLIDVGFGAMTPSEPLDISKENKITNNYKISQNKNNDFVLKIKKKKSFITLYTFNVVQYSEADCIMGNYYSESHPNAVFVNNLVISRKLEDKTLSFRNNSYHHISKTYTNILHITDSLQLLKLLKNDFGITITKKEAQLLFQKSENFRLR